jgi:5-methylcytosine-specific restriction enzyme A
MRRFALCAMAKAAPRPCTRPGCTALVSDGTARCKDHPHESSFASKERGTRQQRGYGAEWDRLRLVILKRDKYLCQVCLRKGIVTSCNIVDHIVPKAEHGTDDPGNLQSICRPCHQEKTLAESLRGRAGQNLGPPNTGPLP